MASNDVHDTLYNALQNAFTFLTSPATHSDTRRDAGNYIENFKLNTEWPICETIGLRIFTTTLSTDFKLFGLMLLEHCIKFRW